MMGTIGRVVVMVACAGLWSLAAATSATAVCGDADGSGTVTVTDGVQVLRAAAGLSSGCTERLASCDVDGNGNVTVSDGVNVLRKAADLPITEAAACAGGGNTAAVAEVTDGLVPFLTLGLHEIPSASTPSARGEVQAAATVQCEDGGSRTTDNSGFTATVTFAACQVSRPQLGSFQFDGTVVASFGLSGGTVNFELRVTDLSNSRLLDFDGTIHGTRSGGGFVVNDGTLSVSATEGGDVLFTLTFHQLTVDGDGKLVSGSVEAEDTSSDSFDLKSAELEVEDSSVNATVHVVFDDDTTADFILNLDTGDLTPAG